MDGEGERRLTAVEANRNFGRVQEEAARGPVVITHHGRPRFAMLAYETYRKLVAGEAEESGSSAAGQRRKLLLILDSIAEGYISISRDWRYVTINRVAEFYLGRPREELVGRLVAEVFPQFRGTEAETRLRRVMEQGEVADFAWSSVVHPARRIGVRAFPLPTPEGGVGVLFSNISERERLERRVRALEARLEAVSAESPDMATIALDDDGIVTEWSVAATALLSWTAEDRVGASFEAILTPEDRAAGRLWSDMAQARRERRIAGTGTYVSHGGEARRLRDVLVRLPEPAGGFLKILRPEP
jgi:prevent-host-death family protein